MDDSLSDRDSIVPTICTSLIQDPSALKEEGNTLFNAGDMQGALCFYTKALKLSDSQAERAVLHRNRSACYLKLEDYTKAEADASKGGRVQNNPVDVVIHQWGKKKYIYIYILHTTFD